MDLSETLLKPSHLIFLYFFITLLSSLAFADPPYNICSTTSYSANNSSIQISNLENLLNTLTSNASASKFYSSSVRNDTISSSVSALYMCLDYVTNKVCQDCIATAAQDIVKLCWNDTEAIVWEEVCQLRYSDRSFFGKLDASGNIPLFNVQNISEPEEFKSVVKSTLSNLTEQAAFNVSANMYATKEVPFRDQTIYALVQCTRDLSAEVCKQCLVSSISDILGCCYNSVGARLLSTSCYLRYELYPFYGSAGAVSDGNTGSSTSGKWKNIILVIVSACLAMAILGSSVYFLAVKIRTRKLGKDRQISNQHGMSRSTGDANTTEIHIKQFQGRSAGKDKDFPCIDLATLYVATNNFSDSNKLGQGGFGPVYKGIVSDGKEVAIKRLSVWSEQGAEEFINEVLLIMKLQHKNLVRLLGFCVDGEEKLLVYEFMPNSSLDAILFDPKKCAQLRWSSRLSIIDGIARGILYLHEDSRLRIIHRDLKASNVLLDYDMKPKISDFGMARIFAGSEGEASTARIVGTYGYMAPEYAMEGLYSVKSDVFSFGILLLEIITGRKNTGFHLTKLAPSLQAYVWKLRNDGKGSDLMDPMIDSCPRDEFLRYIHIGLLCVQEDAYYRPTMSSVVLMLQSKTMILPEPEKPAFMVGRFNDHHETDLNYSVNDLTISALVLR